MSKYRTNNCGELRISDVGKTVKLAGWVQTIRNLGAMKFIDLRDEDGITQVVVSAEMDLKDIVITNYVILDNDLIEIDNNVISMSKSLGKIKNKI